MNLQCRVVIENGRQCGEPVVFLDEQRRGLVCRAHAPQGAPRAVDILISIMAGLDEADHDRRRVLERLIRGLLEAEGRSFGRTAGT